jgi:hypothetical protein
MATSAITPLYNFNGQTYELMQQSPYVYSGTNQTIRQLGGEGQEAGRISYMGGTYRPYGGSIGQSQPQAPLPTGNPTNPYTQKQLAALGDQRSYGRNFDPYQQYVNKMQSVYGVGPVGAAGDVLQSTINGAGKSGPTGGSNG